MTTLPTQDPKRLVAEGYDLIAAGKPDWAERAPSERVLPHLDRVTEGLPDGARVLDLGCGAGVPYARYLSERFDVVGVDISRRQLALARRQVPGASFLLTDMAALAFRPASFDAIAAIYSIIHVPREEHAPLLRRVFDWLRPQGRLLAVLGSSDWEGREQDWLVSGVEMYWSHFGAAANLDLVEQTGFRVLDSQIVPDALDGAHLFVLAEKPA